jgi:hypothetical protein
LPPTERSSQAACEEKESSTEAKKEARGPVIGFEDYLDEAKKEARGPVICFEDYLDEPKKEARGPVIGFDDYLDETGNFDVRGDDKPFLAMIFNDERLMESLRR